MYYDKETLKETISFQTPHDPWSTIHATPSAERCLSKAKRCACEKRSSNLGKNKQRPPQAATTDVHIGHLFKGQWGL